LNLLEIMDYINTTKGVFNEQSFPHITKMIKVNLFRGLKPSAKALSGQWDPDDDDPDLDPAWPHLQYVYEFLLRFVVSNETDPKVVKKFIDQPYLVQLLDLFDSEDPREVPHNPDPNPDPDPNSSTSPDSEDPREVPHAHTHPARPSHTISRDRGLLICCDGPWGLTFTPNAHNCRVPPPAARLPQDDPAPHLW
jgi:hypothetical protein